MSDRVLRAAQEAVEGAEADYARVVELRDAWRAWMRSPRAYARAELPNRMYSAIIAILDAHGLRLEGE